MRRIFEKVTDLFHDKNIKRFFSLTAILFMVLSNFLTGCGLRSPEINTTQLQNEAGDFQYADVSWGMDKASVEAALGITFDPGSVSSSSQSQMYIATDTYTLMGYPATVICEFDASGLYSIHFRFSPDDKDVQTCWDTLTDALLAQYGNVDPSFLSYDSPIRLESEVYLWKHSDTIHTALCAMNTRMSGRTPMIEFTVYVIPEDRIQ